MGLFGPSSSSRHRHNSYSSSSSYYGRRPRDGYINQIVHRLRRMVRRLLAYARRHPVKIFMMVIMPLLTGGALTGVLKQFGIRLPGGAGMKGMFGGGSRMFGGDGYSRHSSRGGLADLGGGGSIQGVMKLVQAFM